MKASLSSLRDAGLRECSSPRHLQKFFVFLKSIVNQIGGSFKKFMSLIFYSFHSIDSVLDYTRILTK